MTFLTFPVAINFKYKDLIFNRWLEHIPWIIIGWWWSVTCSRVWADTRKGSIPIWVVVPKAKFDSRREPLLLFTVTRIHLSRNNNHQSTRNRLKDIIVNSDMSTSLLGTPTGYVWKTAYVTFDFLFAFLLPIGSALHERKSLWTGATYTAAQLYPLMGVGCFGYMPWRAYWRMYGVWLSEDGRLSPSHSDDLPTQDKDDEPTLERHPDLAGASCHVPDIATVTDEAEAELFTQSTWMMWQGKQMSGLHIGMFYCGTDSPW